MVKVRLLLFTVTSGLLELIATVTSAVGAAFSLTSYVPTPASPTVNDAGVKVMPGLSSSSTVTVTDAVTPAYSPPEAVLVMVTNSPSESPSLTPSTVTVCSVSQFDAVKYERGVRRGAHLSGWGRSPSPRPCRPS